MGKCVEGGVKTDPKKNTLCDPKTSIPYYVPCGNKPGYFQKVNCVRSAFYMSQYYWRNEGRCKLSSKIRASCTVNNVSGDKGNLGISVTNWVTNEITPPIVGKACDYVGQIVKCTMLDKTEGITRCKPFIFKSGLSEVCSNGYVDLSFSACVLSREGYDSRFGRVYEKSLSNFFCSDDESCRSQSGRNDVHCDIEWKTCYSKQN